jgi:hypothetical protein
MLAPLRASLPRFLHTSGTELEAHRVPPHIVSFVGQHRDHLQLTAQDQNGFPATKNMPLYIGNLTAVPD